MLSHKVDTIQLLDLSDLKILLSDYKGNNEVRCHTFITFMKTNQSTSKIEDNFHNTYILTLDVVLHFTDVSYVLFKPHTKQLYLLIPCYWRN